jgi:outer membrane protein assembly factor BamB
MFSRSIVTLFSFLCLATSVCAGQAEWPGWLGAQRDGIVTIPFQAPAAWPKKLTEVWKADVGAGYSSPVFDGKTVYLQTRSETQEFLTAFDASNGNPLWQQKLEALTDPMSHEPAATPTLHAGSIYVHSLKGTVYKLNAADGHIAWRRDLPKEWKGESYRPRYGVAASPLIVGDTLALPIGDKEAGKALALKLSDGSTAWEQPCAAPGYGSFVAMKLGGEECLVTVLFERVAAFKKDGTRFVPAFTHELAGGADGNSTTPIALGPDRLVVTGHDATVVLNVAPGAAKCDELWKIERAGNLSSPLCVNGRIYLFDENDLQCVDPANGKLLSKLEMPAQYGALLAWDNMLLCRLHDGTLKFVDMRAPDMKLAAEYPSDDEKGDSWSAPCPISPTQLVMRNGEKLRCLTWTNK